MSCKVKIDMRAREGYISNYARRVGSNDETRDVATWVKRPTQAATPDKWARQAVQRMNIKTLVFRAFFGDPRVRNRNCEFLIGVSLS